MADDAPRYRSLSSWLKERFGEPVRKITLDAGLGCPNRDGTLSSRGCIYCNPRGSGTGAWKQGISLREQVDRGIARLSDRYGCRKFIAYFQSFTNTYGNASHLANLYGQVLERPGIVGMAVGTRPDCVPDPVLDVLEELARDRLIWLEYGVQSIHAVTLDRINRGHGPEAFFDAMERTRQRRIPVVAHLILGLPGESLQNMLDTARNVTQARVQGVKLHPLYVIRGTALEEMYRRGEYHALTEKEAQRATLAVLEELAEDTVIHRMTSDPHPDELVAPTWMLDRRGVRQRLMRAMKQADFHQGSKWNKARSEGKGMRRTLEGLRQKK